jgi:hypothetical protein
MQSITASNVSPFTGHQQIYAYPGQWWEADVVLTPMTRADYAIWAGFFARLNVMENYFYMSPSNEATSRGTPGGTPLVNGNGQAGSSTLVTDGWSLSTTVLQTGDFISVQGSSYKSLYRVTGPVTSDGSGNANVGVWPKVRSDVADNATIEYNPPVGTFRLASPNIQVLEGEDNLFNVQFSVREVFK